MKTVKPLFRLIFSLPETGYIAKTLLLFIIGKSFSASRRFAICISIFMFIILSSTQLFAQDADNYYDTTIWASPDVPKAKLAGRPKLVAKPAQTLAGPTSVNPDIPQSLLCQDLRVVFVLDESGSINGTESETVRTGAKALANALLNSGATLQLVEFSSLSGIVNLGGTTVNSTFITNLNAYLGSNNGTTYSGSGYSGQTYNPGSGGSNCVGWTNWEDALIDIGTIDADLVIFFTDGNPTAYNTTSGGTLCSGQRVITGASDAAALPPAVIQADIIKGQGKHMFLVGVGDDLNLGNIQAISGTDVFGPSHNILTADYTTPPFTELASDLTKAVNAICGTVLQVDKSPSNTGVCAGQSVVFTHTLTNTGGDFNFTAVNVVVKDVYPNGYSNLVLLAPIPAGATITGGNTVNIPVGDMTAGQTLTYQVQATVDVPPGNYNSIITATAFNADEVSDNESVLSGYATEQMNITTCEPVTINDETYTTSGTYTQTLKSVAGCDSILTIVVTAGEPTSNTTTVTECDSYSWTDGQTYTQSGTYYQTSTNASGCEHTEILDLTINYTTSDVTNATACDSYTWGYNGQTYYESGTYNDNTVNAAGCPHIVALILTINKSTNNETTITECDSYTWPVNGQTYTESGTYSETPATDGCPNTETLYLTINKSTSNTATTSACESYTWYVNGQTYTESGTYTASSINSDGCQHTEILELTINKSTVNYPIVTACNSYTWPANGQTYTEGGVYTANSTNAAGCPHTELLNLYINKKPTIGGLACPGSVCRNQTGVKFTVTPGTGATSYEWVLPSGVTGSSTTNSITVAIGSAFTTGAVKVRAKNDCGYSDYVQCTITSPTAVPAVPSCIYGNTSVCTAGNNTYYVTPVAGATSYVWTVSGTGLSIVSGQGTSSIVVAVTASCKSGTICVKAVNCIGSCSSKCITVGLSGKPATPGTICGPITGVCKKTGVVYSVPAVSGATSYVWTVPAGVTITSGAGTNSIKVTFAAGFTGGTITVAAKNTCSTGAASSLTVSALPAKPGSITGSTSCKKSQTVVYSIAAVADATSYTWTVTGGAKFSGTPTGTSATVIFSSCTASSVSLCVKANNACGSSATSCKTISLTASRPLPGGNATELDEESVSVANYKAYPNPSNGQFNISFSTKKMDKVAISIVDVAGRVIYKSVNTYTEGAHLSNINISKFAKGSYFVRLKRNDKEERNIKIFIQ